jgi:5'-nucleotidase / UDP-sugar diphosphatase
VRRALVLLGALGGCLWQGPEIDLSKQDVRLTILHTADIHSRLFPFELAPTKSDRDLGLHAANAPFGGGARLAYLIKRERERSDRVLHLDSGDCFQGAPVFNIEEGVPEIRFLSMVGIDAAVIGNHEFDAGVLNLTEKLHQYATYQNLAANYVFPDPVDPNKHTLGQLAAPYALFNLNGLRVAIIGMANLGSLSSIGEGGNSLKLTPLEQNETVRAYVRLLHGSVDLIGVLSHLGLTEDEELIRGYEKPVWPDRMQPDWTVREALPNGQVMAHIPGVRDIDFIIGGHLHVVLNPPKVVEDPDGREVPIVHSGAFAKYLGRADFVARADTERGGLRIVAHKYQVFPVDNRLAELEDIAVVEMLQPYAMQLGRDIDLRRVIGYAPLTINRRSSTGNGDSGLGNLVAESMRSRRRVGAELAVTNTLGIRDNFYAGPITLEDMYNVFPFENTLVLMYLSGREIQELMDFITERSASRGCQSQAQVAGISFTMNCGQVLENERLGVAGTHPGESIVVNGRPLSDNANYKVAVNDYIGNGGSGFKVLKRNTTKVDTGVPLRSALIDHLATLPPCSEYERTVARYCEQTDDTSQELCRQIGGAGRIPGQPNTKGPYADTPCVLGVEDGRIRRKTSENLDTLPDQGEELPQ